MILLWCFVLKSNVVVVELCEGGFIYNAGRCYKRTNNVQTFSEAQTECETFNATLATIGSSLENLFVQRLLVNSATNVWLGLTRRSSISSWAWIDGSESLYRQWLPNRPLGTESNRQCAIFDGSRVGWEDTQCDSKKHFGLCKKGQYFVLLSYFFLRWDCFLFLWTTTFLLDVLKPKHTVEIC